MSAKVLVVDDQPLVLGVLKEILSRGPYTVLTATSGKEALSLMKQEPIDVVISDERMPGMQGSEFLTIVRQEYPAAVRIILTGHASVGSAIRAINEGEIFRFLTKPVNSDVLHETVREALAHRGIDNSQEKSISLLDSLEKQAPGITSVKRDDDGAVIIEDE